MIMILFMIFIIVGFSVLTCGIFNMCRKGELFIALGLFSICFGFVVLILAG